MSPETKKPKGPETPTSNEVEIASRLTARIKELEAMIMTRGLPREERAKLTEELKPIKAARDLGFDINRAEKAVMAERDREKRKEFTAALKLLKGGVPPKPEVKLPPVPVAAAEETAEPIETGGAGAAEATSRVPEPIVGEEELRALRAIKGLEGQEPGAEAAMGEVATVLKETTRGWRDKMRESKIPGAEILKNFSTKELVEKLGGKKIFGRSALEFILAAGVGGGTRSVVRFGLGALTGGWGYALAAATGAIAGGLVEGTIAHHKELERQKRFKDEEFERFLLGVRENKKKLTEKIDQYLEYARSKDLAEGLPGYKEELRNLLENKLARSAFWRGAAKGAIIGAVGGFVGAAISDWVGSKLGWEIPGAEEAAKVAETLHNNALAEAMAAASADAFNKTNEKLVRAGLAGLDAREFTAFTRRGEGATNLARKLISDYINQHHALKDPTFKFSKAQLVYAEDWLQKYAFTNENIKPRLGEIFKVRGGVIRSALAEARALSPAEIDNINKNWVWKIKDKTWEKIFDFKNVYRAENDFATGIIEEAKRKSGEAARKAAEAAGRAAAMPPPSPAASVAAESWFNASVIKWGSGVAGVGAAVGTALYFKEAISSGAGRAGRAIARGAGRVGKDAAIIGGEFRKFAREIRPSLPSFKRGEAAEPPGKAESEVQEPGPVVDVEAQRRAEETTQRKETERLEAQRTTRERVEHAKKLAADPIRKLLQEGGIIIVPGDRFRYEIPSKESIAKRVGPSISFDNYPDLRQYWESLTPDEKAIAESFETTIGQGEDAKKYPTLNTFAKKDFWDRIEANPELNKRFLELREKALKGLLADEYRGLPEKEDPKVAIDSLMDGLKIKLKGTGLYLYRGDYREITLEEETEGLQKLSRALERIPGEELSFWLIGLKIGRKGIYIGAGGSAIVEIDPSLSEDQMREYILSARQPVKDLRELWQNSYSAREGIKKATGLYVASADHEKIPLADEVSTLRILQDALDDFPIDSLKIAGKETILKIGAAEIFKDARDRVVISIRPNLSLEDIRSYLRMAANEVELLRAAEQK